MRIFVIHRDYYILKAYETLLSQTKHGSKYSSYLSRPSEAIQNQEPHVILIDSGIPSLLDYCGDLRKEHPGIKLFFIANTDFFSVEQINFCPDGRLVKPLTAEKQEQQLFRATHPFIWQIW